MNTFDRIPVDLVVVDSGPLISLALAGELELLKSFRRPIRILDVVREECTRFTVLLYHVLRLWTDLSFEEAAIHIYLTVRSKWLGWERAVVSHRRDASGS